MSLDTLYAEIEKENANAYLVGNPQAARNNPTRGARPPMHDARPLTSNWEITKDVCLASTPSTRRICAMLIKLDERPIRGAPVVVRNLQASLASGEIIEDAGVLRNWARNRAGLVAKRNH